MKYTEVKYLYRDEENNKKHNTVYLEGELTSDEKDEIFQKCQECVGSYRFIPSQVGLPAARFDDYRDDIDGSWFELNSLETVELKIPTYDLSEPKAAQRLLENFRAVVKWNEASETQAATPSGNGGRAPLTGYERFQLQWMMDHGYSLTALMESIHEFWSDPYTPNDTIPELFREWEQDVGFGSEIWPCEAEYLDSAESENDVYRKVKEFEAYQKETDLDDIREWFENLSDEDIQGSYGIARKELEPLFPEMAALMRKRIDDDDEWTYHRDYAIEESLRRYKKRCGDAEQQESGEERRNDET